MSPGPRFPGPVVCSLRWLPARVALLCLLASGCGGAREPPATEDRLRLGWQVPWATQGQLVQVLKHTDLPERNRLRVEYRGFSYGGPLNEAALSGAVDVLLTADQPAAMLIARDPEWVIVGRLMYNRVAIYVPPASPVRRLADLRGKRVGIPFGAAAHRFALAVLDSAGVHPDTGFRALNLDIYEQSAVVAAGDAATWQGLDALVGFDPTPAIFEARRQARMLAVGTVVSLVVANRRYLRDHPGAVARFLKSLHEAYWFYGQNTDVADRWFSQESGLRFDPAVLGIAAAVEPNVSARSPDAVTLELTDRDFRVLDEAAAFVHAHGMVPRRVDMRAAFDPAALREARRMLAEDGWILRPHVLE